MKSNEKIEMKRRKWRGDSQYILLEVSECYAICSLNWAMISTVRTEAHEISSNSRINHLFFLDISTTNHCTRFDLS
jgi:hypothetical protein